MPETLHKEIRRRARTPSVCPTVGRCSLLVVFRLRSTCGDQDRPSLRSVEACHENLHLQSATWLRVAVPHGVPSVRRRLEHPR